MNKIMNYNLYTFVPKIISRYGIYPSCEFSTASTSSVDGNTEIVELLDDDMKHLEDQIEHKRNKSRLSFNHYNMINGRKPYDTPQCLAHLTVKYHRKMLGQYGFESGVNPGLVCWPTDKEIEEVQEYEKVAYPFTIPEMINYYTRKNESKLKQIRKRDEEVAEKFARLGQWKNEMYNRINKKRAEAMAAKEKKDRLVDEVRRHFGFKLDPRDERFQEMLAKREKEQKKLEKQSRRDAKEKEMIAKLHQKNLDIEESK